MTGVYPFMSAESSCIRYTYATLLGITEAGLTSSFMSGDPL